MTEIAESMLSVLGGANCQAEFQEVINRKRSKRTNTPEGPTSGRFSPLSSACEPPSAPAPTQCPTPAQPQSKPQPRPRPRPRTSLNHHHSVPEEERSSNPSPEQHADDERSPRTIEGTMAITVRISRNEDDGSMSTRTTHDVAANPSTTKPEHLPHASAGSTGHENSRPTQQSVISDAAADDGIPDVIVIGTSLIRGLQHRLTTKGAKVKCHMFPGYEVPDIRRELNNILQPQCQPRTIIVQCAGNDIERRRSDHVIVLYEMLINDSL